MINQDRGRLGRERAAGRLDLHQQVDRRLVHCVEVGPRYLAGAAVGLQTDGGLFESFRTHDVTRFQVRAILPFHDEVWRGQISGAKLLQLLTQPSLLGAVHATISPADVDPAKTYSLASTDFIFQILKLDGADTGLDARRAIEMWLAKAPR